jgi:hypothetical protein
LEERWLENRKAPLCGLKRWGFSVLGGGVSKLFA